MTIHYNYKSDFEFVLKVTQNGTDIGFPAFPFEAYVYTREIGKKFKASFDGTACTNCYNDNNTLHVTCDNHKLLSGAVKVEFHALIDNTYFADGNKLNVTINDTDIELIIGNGDDAATIATVSVEYADALTAISSVASKAEAILASVTDSVAKADNAATNANNAATNCKNTDDAVKTNEAARITEFNTLKNNAETATSNANDAAAAANKSATDCDAENKSVSDAEALRVTAENSRVTAENTRVTAENARATEFNTLKNNSETATNNANGAATKAIEAAANVKDGAAATILIGTVASGTTASVTNSGTTNAAKLDFVLPKGDTGTAATVTVGTVTTGAAGSSASVTNSGTSSAAVLDITIPKGDTGAAATVVQETGTSTENVMSQKAVTDALNDYSIEQGNSLIIGLSGSTDFNLNGTKYTRSNPISKITIQGLTKLDFYGSENLQEIYSFPDFSFITSVQGILGASNTAAKVKEVTFPDLPLCTNFSCAIRRNISLTKAVFGKCPKAADLSSFCEDAYQLTDIDISQMDLSNATNLYDMFGNCPKLANVKFGYNLKISLKIRDCNNISENSLNSIIAGLYDLTGSTAQTLTLGSTLLAKLTDAEKKVATDKNWILA